MKTQPILDRFLDKVSPEPMSGCWLWTGFTAPEGYGRLHGYRGQAAHRFSYEQFVAPIPAGHTVDHLCRVPCCVNPKHLEPVTLRENVLRGIGPTAINAKKTHCKLGHPLGTTTTSGGRNCKGCVYQSGLRRTARQRALKTEPTGAL